jgi:hypothetical protein
MRPNVSVPKMRSGSLAYLVARSSPRKERSSHHPESKVFYFLLHLPHLFSLDQVLLAASIPSAGLTTAVESAGVALTNSIQPPSYLETV